MSFNPNPRTGPPPSGPVRDPGWGGEPPVRNPRYRGGGRRAYAAGPQPPGGEASGVPEDMRSVGRIPTGSYVPGGGGIVANPTGQRIPEPNWPWNPNQPQSGFGVNMAPQTETPAIGGIKPIKPTAAPAAWPPANPAVPPKTASGGYGLVDAGYGYGPLTKEGFQSAKPLRQPPIQLFPR